MADDDYLVIETEHGVAFVDRGTLRLVASIAFTKWLWSSAYVPGCGEVVALRHDPRAEGDADYEADELVRIKWRLPTPGVRA